MHQFGKLCFVFCAWEFCGGSGWFCGVMEELGCLDVWNCKWKWKWAYGECEECGNGKYE